MEMKFALGSHANVREVLDLLDVIEATTLDNIPETWRQRQFHAIDYHPGRTGHGGDYIYYGLCRRQKIDETPARARAEATRGMPDDLGSGCVRRDEDVERTLRDYSRYYYRAFGWPHGHLRTSVMRAVHANIKEVHGLDPGSGVPPSAADTSAVCRFFEDAGFIKHDDHSITVSYMRAYIRGRMMR